MLPTGAWPHVHKIVTNTKIQLWVPWASDRRFIESLEHSCATGLSVSEKKVKAIFRLLMGNPMTELRSVTCHVGSHCVTCYPTQVNAPRHNPSQPGWYSIYLPRRDGRLSRPR